MGLSTAITRLATSRVHVLIIEVPGWSMVRMLLEAAITNRGWVLAQAPADADVLLVVGEATETFSGIADGIWNQMPGPRHRESVTTIETIYPTLDAIPAALSDRRQGADARQRPQHVDEDSKQQPSAATVHGTDSHEGQNRDHVKIDHSGSGESAGGGKAETATDESDMDMKMNMDADMDMDMDMSGPAGIPLASGDDSDRDGLEMDVLHLTLGPVLPAWPAGLVVRCTLRGDVIGEAAVEFLPGSVASGPAIESAAGSLAASTARAAVLCDAAGHLLDVAGWEPMAAKVRRVRDGLLTGTAPGPLLVRLMRVSRQLDRSRTLRWSLAGIPRTGEIDARATLLGWLGTAATLLAGGQDVPQGSNWPNGIDELRRALIGQELSAARLIVACIESFRMSDLRAAVHG